MYEYPNQLGAAAQAQMSGAGATAPATPLDQLRCDIDRALGRAGAISHRLGMLGERLVGPVPENSKGYAEAADQISQCGFIPSSSLALDRLHQVLGRIEALIEGFEQTI